MTNTYPDPFRHAEHGNILIYILIGVILIGLLTMAIRDSGDMGRDLSQEQLALKAAKTQRYAAQIQSGVTMLLQNGISETDLRFGHIKANIAYGAITANPPAQVFAPQGGNVAFQNPDPDTGSMQWDFTANLAVPQIGSDKADLLAILETVSEEFCTAINREIGITVTGQASCTSATIPFMGNYASGPVIIDDSKFASKPVPQACVVCDDGTNFYYYTLLAR